MIYHWRAMDCDRNTPYLYDSIANLIPIFIQWHKDGMGNCINTIKSMEFNDLNLHDLIHAVVTIQEDGRVTSSRFRRQERDRYRDGKAGG
jgi:hypothetical protein